MDIIIEKYVFSKVDYTQALRFNVNGGETVIEAFFAKDETGKTMSVSIVYEKYTVGKLLPNWVEEKLKKELKKSYPYGFFPACGGPEWDC